MKNPSQHSSLLNRMAVLLYCGQGMGFEECKSRKEYTFSCSCAGPSMLDPCGIAPPVVPLKNIMRARQNRRPFYGHLS